jgi:hypothetical protein
LKSWNPSPESYRRPACRSGVSGQNAICPETYQKRRVCGQSPDKLSSVAHIERGKLEKDIANLASDDFTTRQKAETALVEAADTARIPLEQALRTPRDLEQCLRLKRLVALLDSPSGNRLRQHRAILALEERGTHRARHLLQKLATGAPEARLTQEAKAALERLARRPASSH